MRLYKNFKEAISETERDLVEMGIRVHPLSYQDVYVGDNPDFDTLELQNHIYTVLHPELKGIGETQPYCDAEWADRLKGIQQSPVNPGEAYKTRLEIWRPFLQEDGKFAYSYSERYARSDQVNNVIDRLVQDRDSRQLFVSMWDFNDSTKLGGASRVPCSLGYLFQVRKGKLNLTYLMRSCDFKTHFRNDIYLSARFQEFMAATCSLEIGTFTHWMGSLHIFKKDGEGVF
jgi:thymidylate synthase